MKMQDLPLEYLGKASASHLEKTKMLTWKMKETNLSQSNYKVKKKKITIQIAKGMCTIKSVFCL